METVNEWADYVLVTNLAAADSSQLILAYCRPENHNDKGCIVSHIDGSVRWCNLEQLTNIPCDVLAGSRVSELKKLPSEQ